MSSAFDNFIKIFVDHILRNNDMIATLFLIVLIVIILIMVKTIKRINKRTDEKLTENMNKIKNDIEYIKQTINEEIKIKLLKMTEEINIDFEKANASHHVIEEKLRSINNKLDMIELGVVGWQELKGFINGISKKRFTEL